MDILSKNEMRSPLANPDISIVMPSIKENPNGRSAVFGKVDIQEDLTHDLLDPEERNLYKEGFQIWKSCIESTSGNISKIVLLEPQSASVVIGYQPFVAIKKPEASILYQALYRTVPDIDDKFRLLTQINRKDEVIELLNIPAIRHVLKKYHQELQLDKMTYSLSTDEIVRVYMDLNRSDNRSLANGLLSGFPYQDCVMYASTLSQWDGKTQFKPTDIDSLIYSSITTRKSTVRIPYNPEKHIEREDLVGLGDTYYPQKYIIDERKDLDTPLDFMCGFGLYWRTSVPPSTDAILQGQKLLQIDRELGILDFVNKQRTSFPFMKVIDDIDDLTQIV
jgi:hypothetical protein